MSFFGLPNEIQQKIWEYELNVERILHVQLTPPSTVWSAPVRRGGYKISLVERRPISKVFHINRTSRAVAQGFYRVHLPCSYSWEGKVEDSATLYFHLELDTVEVQDWYDNCFSLFAQDLWDNDSRRVGLINLMIGTLSITDRLGGDDLLLQHALRRLQRVTFVPETRQYGRQPCVAEDYYDSEEWSCFRHYSFKPPSSSKFIRHGPERRRAFVGEHLPWHTELDEINIPEAMEAWLQDWVVKADLPLELAFNIRYQFILPYGARTSYRRDHFVEHGSSKDRRRRINRSNARIGGLGEQHVKNLMRVNDCGIDCTTPPGFWLFKIEACIGKPLDSDCLKILKEVVEACSKSKERQFRMLKAISWAESHWSQYLSQNFEKDVCDAEPELCLYC